MASASVSASGAAAAAAAAAGGGPVCITCAAARPLLRVHPCGHVVHPRCVQRWPLRSCARCAQRVTHVAPVETLAEYTYNGRVVQLLEGEEGDGEEREQERDEKEEEREQEQQQQGKEEERRKGRWSRAETHFAEEIVREFERGRLPLPARTKLTAFLSELLDCDTLRLTSKLHPGRKVFVWKGETEAEAEQHETEFTERHRDIAQAEQLFLDEIARSGTPQEAAALCANMQRVWLRHFWQFATECGQSLSEADAAAVAEAEAEAKAEALAGQNGRSESDQVARSPQQPQQQQQQEQQHQRQQLLTASAPSFLAGPGPYPVTAATAAAAGMHSIVPTIDSAAGAGSATIPSQLLVPGAGVPVQLPFASTAMELYYMTPLPNGDFTLVAIPEQNAEPSQYVAGDVTAPAGGAGRSTEPMNSVADVMCAPLFGIVDNHTVSSSTLEEEEEQEAESPLDAAYKLLLRTMAPTTNTTRSYLNIHGRIMTLLHSLPANISYIVMNTQHGGDIRELGHLSTVLRLHEQQQQPQNHHAQKPRRGVGASQPSAASNSSSPTASASAPSLSSSSSSSSSSADADRKRKAPPQTTMEAAGRRRGASNRSSKRRGKKCAGPIVAPISLRELIRRLPSARSVVAELLQQTQKKTSLGLILGQSNALPCSVPGTSADAADHVFYVDLRAATLGDMCITLLSHSLCQSREMRAFTLPPTKRHRTQVPSGADWDLSSAQQALEHMTRMEPASTTPTDIPVSMSDMLRRFLYFTGFRAADWWIPISTGNSEAALVQAGGCVSTPDLQGWVAYSEHFCFAPGQGLPGRVYHTHEDEMQPDVSQLSHSMFLRCEGARRLGVRGSAGFLLAGPDGEVAVVVFYSSLPLQLNDRDRDTIRNLLGSVCVFVPDEVSAVRQRTRADAMQQSQSAATQGAAAAEGTNSGAALPDSGRVSDLT